MMARLYVESTPATRGEVDPEVYKLQLDVEQLRALADEHGFDLVARDPEDEGAVDETAEPAANASRARWEAYARTVHGASDEDLQDEDGKPLKRNELAAKYGGLI